MPLLRELYASCKAGLQVHGIEVTGMAQLEAVFLKASAEKAQPKGEVAGKAAGKRTSLRKGKARDVGLTLDSFLRVASQLGLVLDAEGGMRLFGYIDTDHSESVEVARN